MSKVPILKNARNYAEYLRKKERGPVKAFFHITKNENIPAIEQQGLLTEHPNANVNSANHPFRKHGTDAGGVWVTTEPLAFPVYGTTIGGKYGNAAARADALSTIKIEVPVSELPTMRAVQDPYGKNILRKGNDPRAIKPFPTWTGNSVPTTVFLDDMKPEWLKSIGYVEENAPSYRLIETDFYPLDVEGSWRFGRNNPLRMLDKSRLRDASGLTGHHHNNPQDAAKSPVRFVDEYLDKNHPITDRLPTLPELDFPEHLAYTQNAAYEPKYVLDGAVEVLDPIETKRYSMEFVPASEWTSNYRDYVKPGESITESRHHIFAPGAISRGMGGTDMPSVKDRHFSWNRYKQRIAEGAAPYDATIAAMPDAIVDWNNIIYKGNQYQPAARPINDAAVGAISRGEFTSMDIVTGKRQADLRRAADIMRNHKLKATEFLSRNLGRQPTAEEIDNWARASVWNAIEADDLMDVPAGLGAWADKTDWNIDQRLSDELFHRMDNRRNKKTREI